MQILSGLQAIHSGELVHRGLTTHFIGLANRTEAPGQGQSKVVKVGKAAYYMRLLDLHRSNPFGNDISSVIGYFNLPQEWCVFFLLEVQRDLHERAYIRGVDDSLLMDHANGLSRN